MRSRDGPLVISNNISGPLNMLIFGLSPTLGYTAGYDPKINSALTAEFAVAALRFGHSIVDGKIK